MTTEPRKDEIVFYHCPQSRALIVHWMLEEIGRPYHMRIVDVRKGEQDDPAYRAINPMGKVPALSHGGAVVTEAAAICTYLADAFPEAGLSVPMDDPRRGTYLRWLFFGPSCLEPAVVDRMFKREMPPSSSLGYGTFERTMDVVAAAVLGSPYLLGDRFTAADVVIGSGLIWGMGIKAVPERPEFAAYTGRLRARPALGRVYAKDAELMAAHGQ